jgi:hypothetical protein
VRCSGLLTERASSRPTVHASWPTDLHAVHGVLRRAAHPQHLHRPWSVCGTACQSSWVA